MLCSERELELGEDHAGIMLLEGDYETGAPFAKAVGLDDVRLDVEVTPNRGDLLSHVGIARELHPEGEAGIALPSFPGGTPVLDASFARGTAESGSAGVRIQIEDPDLCPRYLGAVIRGVKVGPSPRWLADRLTAAGARPINNVVDATNYVMLELGQPLHAFDLDRLTDATIVVGRARPGESLVTLDGEERAVTPDMLMIRDAEVPVAVAGVMGGRDSEVSAESVNIVLECALFEPKQVRAARRALGMSTDASYRFERGVDPVTMETALTRAASLIVAVAGGGGGGRGHRCPPRAVGGAGGVAAALPRPSSARCGVHARRDRRASGAAGVFCDGAGRRRAGGGRSRPPQLRHPARGGPHRGGRPHPRLRRLPRGHVPRAARDRAGPPALPARGHGCAALLAARRDQRGADSRARTRNGTGTWRSSTRCHATKATCAGIVSRGCSRTWRGTCPGASATSACSRSGRRSRALE